MQIPRIAIALCLAGIASTALPAQTLGGIVSCHQVVTHLPKPNAQYISQIQYTNWQWKDSKGIVHDFAGSSITYYEWVTNAQGKVVSGGPNDYSELGNVQASDGTLNFLTTNNGTGSVNGFGVIGPKYQVVNVVYAPPGTGAIVDYGTSSVAGTSTTVTQAFTQGASFQATVGGSFFNLLGGTTSYNASFTETTTSSNTISVNKSASFDLKSGGQDSPAYGINHDFDEIYICLNPRLEFGASTNPAVASAPQWTLGYDSADTNCGNAPDILSLTVKQLKNPSLITDASMLNRLARTWAGSNQGLTTADFTEILARDPYANDGTNGTRPVVASGSSSNRFQQIGSVSYEPLAAGEGPQTESGTLTYQTISSQSTTAQDVYSVSSTDKADVNFFYITGIQSTSNYTWTNTAIQANSSLNGQSASYAIPRPPSTWTGASNICVWQDAIFGSFLFSW